MMEMAIDLLGPDFDLVSEPLLELRGSHSRFGVTRAHFDTGIVIRQWLCSGITVNENVF
jgi:hypothetical protein